MILRVLEHQKLRIGEYLSQSQWQALAAFAQQRREPYFRILHNGVQFAQYVGALQVGELTIEILPKIEETDRVGVQAVLVEMLRACRLLQPQRTTVTHLNEQSGSLLEFYIIEFLQEVEQLLRTGLTRTYVEEALNRRTFKGKLLLHRQIVKNLVRPNRFFTETLEYSYNHPFNQLIFKALNTLGCLPLSAALNLQLQHIRQQLPPLEDWRLPLPDFDALRFNRHTLRYKNALQTALLILQHIQPDVRAGRLPVVALLFDMNALFEQFVFQQLQQAAGASVQVQRQVPKSFWNRRSIQPDIVLSFDNQRIVIDTKWKKLQKVSPAMDDLRQMYVYNQYFAARHSVLVYPRVAGLQDLEPVPFQPVKAEADPYFCQVRLVDLARDGQLNRQLGSELLLKIVEKATI